jgi:hypothetical protein
MRHVSPYWFLDGAKGARNITSAPANNFTNASLKLRHICDAMSVAGAGPTIKSLFDGRPRIDKYFNLTAFLLQQNA